MLSKRSNKNYCWPFTLSQGSVESYMLKWAKFHNICSEKKSLKYFCRSEYGKISFITPATSEFCKLPLQQCGIGEFHNTDSASRFCRLPLWFCSRVGKFHNTGRRLPILQEEVAATLVPLQEPQSCCSPPPASTSPTSPAFSTKSCFTRQIYFKHITAYNIVKLPKL